MSCKDCKFVKKLINGFDKKESFICNRFPPIPQVINTPQGPSVMCVDPPVQSGGWCGEWQEKEEHLGGLTNGQLFPVDCP